MGEVIRRFVAGWLLLAVGWLAAGQVMAQERGASDRRLALVIGNASYRIGALKNPANDARDMAKALRALGFEVIERQNLTRETFAGAVREFGDRLRGASVGLFYFAGHGLQVKGRNFLVPVDADIAREDEVPYRSFDVNEVLDKMDSARTPVNLVVLDACRNNPFARSFKTSQVGLAQMDAPAGTLIAFATAPGSVALDGEAGANGLYTGALLKHIGAPGVAVEQMFKRVRVDVVASSKNSQVPWESSSLSRDFSFATAAAAALAPAPAAGPAASFAPTELALELAFWDAVKDSSNPADYRAYLEQYPQGRFAALARVRAAVASPPPAAAAEAPVVAAAPAAMATPRTNTVRWRQGSAERSLELNVAQAVSAQATSPEGLYLAAVAGGTVFWIDALRATVVRRSNAPEAAATEARFSPDGRWLLLKLERAGRTSHGLIDVGSGELLWDKPSSAARFDAAAPLLTLQTAQGNDETLRLP